MTKSLGQLRTARRRREIVSGDKNLSYLDAVIAEGLLIQRRENTLSGCRTHRDQLIRDSECRRSNSDSSRRDQHYATSARSQRRNRLCLLVQHLTRNRTVCADQHLLSHFDNNVVSIGQSSSNRHSRSPEQNKKAHSLCDRGPLG